MIIFFIIFLISFAVTFLTFRLIIPRLRQAGIVGRDMHKPHQPEIPEIGGLAIITGFSTAIVTTLALTSFTDLFGSLDILPTLAVFSTILIVALIGTLDDLIFMRQWVKAIIPLIAALPLMVIKVGDTNMTIPLIGQVDFGILYSVILVPIGVTAAANAVNMLAGFNGSEAGMGTIAMGSLAIIAYALGETTAFLILLAGLGALLATLYYNWYPAKVFIGDVGTLSIGTIIASAVVSVHGQDLQVTLYKNARCKKALEKVFKQADKVVTVSTKLKEIAKAIFGFPEKFIVNNNGINPEELASEITISPSKYADYKVLLSVSHLIASKGLDLNVKATSQLVKKYPNLKYLVIGAGPEKSALKQLTQDLNLDERVEFLGELPHERVMGYMALADIFSLPSWQEGFGIAYLEAMAHGKPVIACQGEGITDVIENNKTGLLVKPKDVESLTRAMEFLLENPQQASDMGERAKKLVLENYTWEKNTHRYIEIYKELLAYDA